MFVHWLQPHLSSCEHTGAGLSSSLLGPRTPWPGGAETLPGSQVEQGAVGLSGENKQPWVGSGVSEQAGGVRRGSEGVGRGLDSGKPRGEQSLTGHAQSGGAVAVSEAFGMR